ncbi:TPA: LuxR C-terminal-related transcriptional regulator [Salmonella enterica subsp. enterica serovar Chester]
MTTKRPVIVLTSCGFLLAGLKSVLQNATVPVRLVQATVPDEILTCKEVSDAAMILVARESDTPAVVARTLMQMRRLHWFMMAGVIPWVPCLLPAGDMSITVAGKSFWLTRKYVSLDMDILFGGILAYPALYLGMSAWNPLSEQQKVILEGTLAGVGVEALAEQMCLRPHTVFVHRDKLIKKLGLHNRMGLICLSHRDFAGMDDIPSGAPTLPA